MAAIGPDFKAGFLDPTPVSNADLAPTVARILGLTLSSRGTLTGRVISEPLAADGAPVPSASGTLCAAPAENGFTTVLDYLTAAGKTDYDAAGAPGRVIGLRPVTPKNRD